MLALHENELWGTIPQSIVQSMFTDVSFKTLMGHQIMTMHGNFLSCELPDVQNITLPPSFTDPSRFTSLTSVGNQFDNS